MLGHSFDELHLNQQLSEIFDWQWFGIYLVHAAAESLVDVLVLYVTGDGHDPWLLVARDVHLGISTADALAGLVPIDEGHVAVHQNERVPVWVTLVDGLLDHADGLLAVVGEVDGILGTWEFLEAQNHEEAVDDIAVELLVIYYQDLSRVEHPLLGHDDRLRARAPLSFAGGLWDLIHRGRL